MNVQLPLGIALERGASFTTFWPAGNEAALAALQERSDTNLYLWGERATGKTHLLQAACAAAGAGRAAYLPCAELERFVPQVIEGWESLGLVCLDDVHLIAGRREWEHAVFTLYEALRENGGRLLVTAHVAPAALRLGLADLRTRLGWGLVFHLRPLDDEGKLAALRLRAERRGFELPEETARYLLSRFQRDMRTLCGLLEALDTASLAAQRRLTIPFVKSVLPPA